MGDDSKLEELASLASSSPLLKLTTETVAADGATPSAAAPGLAALHKSGVSIALRSALHMVGETATTLSAEHKSRLAERFIHQRIEVDEHTAAAVLLESFSLPRVCIVRKFPGAAPPPYDTIALLLQHPPSGDHVAYSFNEHRSRIHYVFTSLMSDKLSATQARDWWRGVNRLKDTGKLDDLSAGTQWNFVSRRGKACCTSIQQMEHARSGTARSCGCSRRWTKQSSTASSLCL